MFKLILRLFCFFSFLIFFWIFVSFSSCFLNWLASQPNSMYEVLNTQSSRWFWWLKKNNFCYFITDQKISLWWKARAMIFSNYTLLFFIKKKTWILLTFFFSLKTEKISLENSTKFIQTAANNPQTLDLSQRAETQLPRKEKKTFVSHQLSKRNKSSDWSYEKRHQTLLLCGESWRVSSCSYEKTLSV